MKLTRIAGWMLIGLGCMHMAFVLSLAWPYVGGWFSGELWTVSTGEPGPSGAYFWGSLGSFAVPQVLLGANAVWLGRSGRTGPALVGWGIVGWALLCAAVMEPTPFVTAVVPGILLIVDARRAGRRQSDQDAKTGRDQQVATRLG